MKKSINTVNVAVYIGLISKVNVENIQFLL